MEQGTGNCKYRQPRLNLWFSRVRNVLEEVDDDDDNVEDDYDDDGCMIYHPSYLTFLL